MPKKLFLYRIESKRIYPSSTYVVMIWYDIWFNMMWHLVLVCLYVVCLFVACCLIFVLIRIRIRPLRILSVPFRRIFIPFIKNTYTLLLICNQLKKIGNNNNNNSTNMWCMNRWIYMEMEYGIWKDTITIIALTNQTTQNHPQSTKK